MNIKSFLIGFLTGIVLLVVMYYPLYVDLPSSYVEGWQSGPAGLSTGLEIVAGIVVLLGGLIAGLVQRGGSRWRGVATGAVAGWFAGFVLFCGLGAAAAGTEGAGVLLVHGMNPATDNTQFNALMVEAVIRTIFWTYRTMWWMILGGILLGAIGGGLAPPGKKAKKEEVLSGHESVRKLSLAIGSVTATVLVLVVVTSIFSLQEEAVRKAALEVGVTPSLPSSGVLTYPTTSALFIYLIALIWLVRRVRKASYSEDPNQIATASISAYIGGFFVFGTLVSIYLINSDLATSRYFVIGGALSFVLGGVLLISGFGLGRRAKRAVEKVSPLSLRRRILIIGYPIGAILFWIWLMDRIPSRVSILIGISLMFGYLILIYYLVYRGRKIEKQELEIGFFNPTHWRDNWFSLTAGGSLAIFFPVFAGSVQTGINLVVIVIQMIVPLANYGPSADPNIEVDITTADLIRQAFLTQASTALIWFFVTFVGVGLFTWFIGFVIQWAKKSDTQEADHSSEQEQPQS